MADWTEDSKAELVKQYLAQEPTGENSMEIVAKLAPDFDATPNGARMILVKAAVYVKKEAKSGTASKASSGEKKESKADSIARLTSAIEAQGLEADGTITGKMTGKAAAYFADIITKVTVEED